MLFYRKVLRILLHFEEVYEQSVNNGNKMCIRDSYDTEEALDVCVKTGTAKFDETVELHVKLGVDGRHADQPVSYTHLDVYKRQGLSRYPKCTLY